MYFIEKSLLERLKHNGGSNPQGLTNTNDDGLKSRNMSEIQRRIKYGNK